MTDEPNSMKVHLDMLRVIANNRQSDKLFNLLSAVSGYTRPNKPEVDEKENGKWLDVMTNQMLLYTHAL
jgi:hypothetical protein